MNSSNGPCVTLAMAAPEDMDAIFRMRHQVYATELGQHEENAEGRLRDSLDAFNSYVVAKMGGDLAGFISITPPGSPSYSVDKYFPRGEAPVPFDDGLYELRILTVDEARRGGIIAPALMYAALRWIEERGGRNLIAIGRTDLLDLYVKAGMRPTGKRVQAGAVAFELLTCGVRDAHNRLLERADVRGWIDRRIDWRLDAPMGDRRAAYHGGASFDAVGSEFDDLSRIDGVINADVLDAWFPPAPGALDALGSRLDWAIRSSPPTGSEGLIARVAAARGVPPDLVLPGAGSSALIFLALRERLTASSRALILDPAYGEYAHVLENVIGCRTRRLPLSGDNGYLVETERLEAELSKGYDFAALVNPNNPTGRHIPRDALEDALSKVPPETVVWIDETYVDYVDPDESLERFAAASKNVVVCKSMSKAYALSGLRVGYLCGPARLIEPLRALTPPWAVSLPAQIAAVKALEDPAYYAARYAETRALREELAGALQALGGFETTPGAANFLLCRLSPELPMSETLIAACKERGLFLRNAALTAPLLGDRAVRIAVKDAATNKRMVGIIGEVLRGGR